MQSECSNFLDSNKPPRYTAYCSQNAIKDASAYYRHDLTYEMVYRERWWVISSILKISYLLLRLFE
jgi:hypothetical protein